MICTAPFNVEASALYPRMRLLCFETYMTLKGRAFEHLDQYAIISQISLHTSSLPRSNDLSSPYNDHPDPRKARGRVQYLRGLHDVTPSCSEWGIRRCPPPFPRRSQIEALLSVASEAPIISTKKERNKRLHIQRWVQSGAIACMPWLSFVSGSCGTTGFPK